MSLELNAFLFYQILNLVFIRVRGISIKILGFVNITAPEALEYSFTNCKVDVIFSMYIVYFI